MQVARGRLRSAGPLLFFLCLSMAAAGASIRVDRVVFTGNTAIPQLELEEIARPYVGRQVSEAEIEELRQKITRLCEFRRVAGPGR